MASTGPEAGADGAGAHGPSRAAHDLLVGLAGRLPDRVLWRLRDWLAADAGVALRTALPRTLLRHRVAVTEDERSLLREAVAAWRGPTRLVDAVLHTDAPPASEVAFTPPADAAWDAADLVLRALVPAVGDVGEVRRAWRAAGPGRDEARVVLISAAGDLPTLTGAVQRALRAQGDLSPCVEVIGAGTATAGYHRAALAASDVLWRDGEPATAAPGATDGDAATTAADGRAAAPPPELVRHG